MNPKSAFGLSFWILFFLVMFLLAWLGGFAGYVIPQRWLESHVGSNRPEFGLKQPGKG